MKKSIVFITKMSMGLLFAFQHESSGMLLQEPSLSAPLLGGSFESSLRTQAKRLRGIIRETQMVYGPSLPQALVQDPSDAEDHSEMKWNVGHHKDWDDQQETIKAFQIFCADRRKKSIKEGLFGFLSPENRHAFVTYSLLEDMCREIHVWGFCGSHDLLVKAIGRIESAFYPLTTKEKVTVENLLLAVCQEVLGVREVTMPLNKISANYQDFFELYSDNAFPPEEFLPCIPEEITSDIFGQGLDQKLYKTCKLEEMNYENHFSLQHLQKIRSRLMNEKSSSSEQQKKPSSESDSVQKLAQKIQLMHIQNNQEKSEKESAYSGANNESDGFSEEQDSLELFSRSLGIFMKKKEAFPEIFSPVVFEYGGEPVWCLDLGKKMGAFDREHVEDAIRWTFSYMMRIGRILQERALTHVRRVSDVRPFFQIGTYLDSCESSSLINMCNSNNNNNNNNKNNNKSSIVQESDMVIFDSKSFQKPVVHPKKEELMKLIAPMRSLRQEVYGVMQAYLGLVYQKGFMPQDFEERYGKAEAAWNRLYSKMATFNKDLNAFESAL